MIADATCLLHFVRKRQTAPQQHLERTRFIFSEEVSKLRRSRVRISVNMWLLHVSLASNQFIVVSNS